MHSVQRAPCCSWYCRMVQCFLQLVDSTTRIFLRLASLILAPCVSQVSIRTDESGSSLNNH